MKRLVTILMIVSTFSMSAHAGERGKDRLSRMTFGLEWGYTASIHTAYHYSYFVPEGYRTDEYGSSFSFISNAGMFIHFGYDLSTLWNLSMYIGYEGISDIHKAVPASLRITRYFGDNPLKDRWFSFLDLGSGICLKNPVQEILTGKAGGGYRLVLSRHASLDFLLSARLTHTHPQIFYDRTPVSFDKTTKNIAYVSAISVGMAINF